MRTWHSVLPFQTLKFTLKPDPVVVSSSFCSVGKSSHASTGAAVAIPGVHPPPPLLPPLRGRTITAAPTTTTTATAATSTTTATTSSNDSRHDQYYRTSRNYQLKVLLCLCLECVAVVVCVFLCWDGHCYFECD